MIPVPSLRSPLTALQLLLVGLLLTGTQLAVAHGSTGSIDGYRVDVHLSGGTYLSASSVPRIVYHQPPRQIWYSKPPHHWQAPPRHSPSILYGPSTRYRPPILYAPPGHYYAPPPRHHYGSGWHNSGRYDSRHQYHDRQRHELHNRHHSDRFRYDKKH